MVTFTTADAAMRVKNTPKMKPLPFMLCMIFAGLNDLCVSDEAFRGVGNRRDRKALFPVGVDAPLKGGSYA